MLRWLPLILATSLLASAGCATGSSGGGGGRYAVHDDPPPRMAPIRASAPAPGAAAPRRVEVASLRPVPIDPELLHGPDVDDAPAATYPSRGEWAREHRFECVGPRAVIDPPAHLRLDHGRAVHHGWRVEWTPAFDTPEDQPVRLGVLGAPKDAWEGTLANLRRLLSTFDQAGVDVIVVAGDLGYTAGDIATTLALLGASGRLVLALPGNADPVRGFHHAVAEVARRHPNVVDGSLVRLVELGPATLVTLPGYHDPRFIASEDGCRYEPEHVEALAELFDAARARAVLVAHGPPRGEGPGAIDFAFDAGNVGDPAVTAALAASGVRLGLFSHILEAGGRATDPVTGRAVAPDAWSTALWLNVGAATSAEQDLHGGAVSHGMASVVELGAQGARYRVVRAE